MSSALKPVLPPTGTQNSATNPSTSPGKPLSGNQNMAQHAGAPGPYSTGPLGHVPQNMGGLPHSHGNLGLASTNIASNMSMNTVSNMTQMGGHGSMNQTPHNMQGTHTSPIKNSTLPPSATASVVATPTTGATHGRPAPHTYLSGGNAPPGPPQEEGTTLPPSQNSAQLMAVHRAQQQQNQQHNQNQQHHPEPLQPQQNTTDRFKTQSNQQAIINQQQPQQAQQQPPGQIPQTPSSQPSQPQQSPQNQQSTPVQSNGTVSGSTDTTNNKITVPTPPIIDAKLENIPSVTSAVQNHVAPTSNDHDVNNSKQPEISTSPIGNASVPAQTQPTINSEQKLAAATTPTVEPAAEAPQAATTPTKAAAVPKETPVKPPSTMKLATTPRTTNRKRETKKVSENPKSASSPSKTPDGKSPGAQNNRPPDKTKTPRTPSEERKSKRTRTRTQPYQSPLPELALISKLSSSAASPSKHQDEKLIVFYKNEFLAVRNAEGGFYVCQAVQNVYKSSLRIRIRWLSQDKQDKIYIPDFYDTTDFDCILTNLNMERVEKGKYNLPKDELERTENILKRALAVESGEATPSLTEEHPDGLDLSLFRDESQLKKKRKSSKRKSVEPLSTDNGSTNNKRTKRTPDKSKVRKMSKSPAPKATTRKNSQSMDRKSTSNSNSSTNNSIDKKDGANKTARKSDGGRAERAKRRGETSTPIITKTSPVVDQKKARVLAKVALKTAIPANIPAQNKKKAGRNTPTGNGKNVSTTPVKTGIKSTRSAAAANNSSPVATTATTSASTSSTRRGKKTKK